MKIKVYDSLRSRYLTEGELEGLYFYNGSIQHDPEGSWEDIDAFRVNLHTMKIQTEQTTGNDPDTSSGTMWKDDDNFRIEVPPNLFTGG